MSLAILETGLQTLVVDAGRPCSRSLGIPLGGAADPFSWRLGNLLLGNPEDLPALEFSLVGPTIEAQSDLRCVVTGAPFHVEVAGRSIPPYWTFFVRKFQQIRIGGTPTSARGYLCVQGGIQTKPIMESCSTWEPIRRDQVLPCSPSDWCPQRGISPPQMDRRPIRAIAGPQADWFDGREFFGQKYEVTSASNRMGLRLQGNPLMRQPRELVSEPVAPGTVQVVNDGQCIILGVEGQTIGGYPKVAQIIAADLDRIGQLRPGDRISFQLVTLEEADHAWHERMSKLAEWQTRLSFPVPRG